MFPPAQRVYLQVVIEFSHTICSLHHKEASLVLGNPELPTAWEDWEEGGFILLSAKLWTDAFGNGLRHLVSPARPPIQGFPAVFDPSFLMSTPFLEISQSFRGVGGIDARVPTDHKHESLILCNNELCLNTSIPTLLAARTVKFHRYETAKEESPEFDMRSCRRFLFDLKLSAKTET